jgi:hypothetical protein
MPKCADGGQERERTVTWTKGDQGETVRLTKLSAEGLATSALGPSLEEAFSSSGRRLGTSCAFCLTMRERGCEASSVTAGHLTGHI